MASYYHRHLLGFWGDIFLTKFLSLGANLININISKQAEPGNINFDNGTVIVINIFIIEIIVSFDSRQFSIIFRSVKYNMIRKCQFLSKYFVANFNPSKDYYRTLNISKTATQSQIKKAYLKYAKMYHPDTNKGQEDKFKQINQAYQVLSSEIDKKDYDAARNSASSTSSNPYTSQSYQEYNQYNNPKQQTRGSSHQSTYRGYQSQQNWNNPYYRQKVMEDMINSGKFNRYPGRMSQKQFDELLKNRANNARGFRQMYDDYDEVLRKRTQVTREQINKAIKQEQLRRQKEYKEYQQRTSRNLQKQFEERAWKMYEGVKNNIEGVSKIGNFMKSVWTDVKDNIKNKKK